MADDPSNGADDTTPDAPTPASEAPRFYVNAVQAQGGPWDLSLTFGQQMPPKDPEWAVSLLMSWEHAKALLGVLNQFVENFERDIGDIPTPPEDKNEIAVPKGGEQ